jgi:hypothetical protein
VPPHKKLKKQNSGCVYATYRRCELCKLYVFATSFPVLALRDFFFLGVDNFPPPLSTLPELAGRIRAVTLTKVWGELE